jgi:hypothetical protein
MTGLIRAHRLDVAPRSWQPLIALALLPLLGACDTLHPPAPWEKDVLSRPAMRMDAAPLEARFDRQVYTSKESPSGGGDVGGGGCGCN